MMNFWLATRPRPGADRDLFDFEWGIMHVALMLTTPSVMEGFVKYAQHRVPDGVPEAAADYRAHENNWYGLSNHQLPELASLERIFSGEDYPRRMTPHSFGDDQFTIELTHVLVEADLGGGPVRGRGVKVVNFLAAAPGVDQDTYASVVADEYAPRLLQFADEGGELQRYVHNIQLPLDAAMFQGTLFEKGGVQTYAAIEELWFPSLQAAQRFRERREHDHELQEIRRRIIDADRSFSMVTVERVVWDFAAPDAPKPAAVSDHDGVEARTLASERPWGRWNEIVPEQYG